MFANVLVAVDGSRHAARALDEAIDLARCQHARLTLLVSVPDPASWPLGAETAAGFAALAPGIEREHQALLDAAAARVPDDVPVAKLLTHGWAGPAIVRAVQEGGHDLVVMGSRGHGELRSLLLGSVSHHVVHARASAVLVVHAQD
jgi:nucleotide-binding universal stress UspA family protein